MNFNFSDDFQLGILDLMTKDGRFATKASLLLQPDYFKNKYFSWFFETFKKLFQNYGEINLLSIENEILKFDEEDRELFFNLFEKIKNPETKRNFDYIRDQLEKFIKKATAFHINQKLVKNRNNDPDKIYQMIKKEIEKIATISFQQDDYISIKDAHKIMERSKDNSARVLPLGLPKIDTALGGGIPRGTLTLALGGTNVGKSVFLINLAYQWVMSGLKVLYVSMEGEEDQPMLRLISRSLKINYGKVRNYDLNDNQYNQVNSWMKKYGDSIRMVFKPAFKYTIEDFWAYCVEIKNEFNFDAIVLDYGQLLQSKEKFENVRLKQAYVHQGLDSLAAVLKCGMITVAQGNRDGQDKNDRGELLRMKDIAECFEIVRKAATVLTLNRSDNDEKAERLRILLDKQRDGAKGIIEICKTNMRYVGYYGSEAEGLGFISSSEAAEIDKIEHDNNHTVK